MTTAVLPREIENGTQAETQQVEAPLLLTVEEVARLLNLARSYVYSGLLVRGVIKSVRIGRRRLVARRDLEAYIESLRENSAA